MGFNELIKRTRAGEWCGWAARCTYQRLTRSRHTNKKYWEILDHLGENTCTRMHHNTEPPISYDIYIMTRSSESASGTIELATSLPALDVSSYPHRRSAHSCQIRPYYPRSSILLMYCFAKRCSIFMLNLSIPEKFIFCVKCLLLIVISQFFLISILNFLSFLSVVISMIIYIGGA